MANKHWAVVGVGAALVVLSSLFAASVQAAPNGIYLAGATTVSAGDVTEVQVRTNSSFAATVVQANLSYDSSKLEFQSIDPTNSRYEISVESTGGAGTVRIARATFTAAAGDALVAIVRFKVLASSGATQINFEGGTMMTDSVSTDSTTTPLLLSLQAAPLPTANPTTAPVKVTPRPTSIPPPQPTADTTAPVVIDSAVTQVGMISATITWKTDEPTTGLVAYGGSQSYGYSQAAADMTMEHSVVLKEGLQPATTFNFKIIATDAAGNQVATQNQIFVTAGVPVSIRVTDQTGMTLSGATVALNGRILETAQNGEADFELGLGPHDIEVQYGDTIRRERYTVSAPDSEAERQVFVVAVQVQPASSVMSTTISIMAIGVLATVVFGVIKFIHRPRKPGSLPLYKPGSPWS